MSPRASTESVKSQVFWNHMDYEGERGGSPKENVPKEGKVTGTQNKQQMSTASTEDWNILLLSSNGGSFWCHVVLR